MLLVSRAASASEGCSSVPFTGQETTTFVSKAGCTVSVERMNKRDESMEAEKTNDKSELEERKNTEGQAEVDTGEHEKTSDDEEPEDELSIKEFEDPVYELSQAYKIEPEYETMTVEQEAAEVQALLPITQAGYWELTKLRQRQADIEKKMTGVSKIVEERTKA